MRRPRPPARPSWARRRSLASTQPKRDWIAIGALTLAGLPGLAALLALVFTYQQVNATNVQLRIAEQGQITDRYNAAITNLGSRSIEVRLGGIYALQRLMQDSPRDQVTIVSVLCAFVRDQTSPAARSQHPPSSLLPTDIQATLTVVGTRNTANDGPNILVDFSHAQLANADLDFLHLSGAYFYGANLSGATLVGTYLSGAYLSGASLTRVNASFASLVGAHLADADLAGANLAGANLTRADLTRANLTGVDLAVTDFTGADLAGAEWSKNLLTPAGWVRDPGSGRLRRASDGA